MEKMEKVLSLQMFPTAGLLDDCVSDVSCESDASCKSDVSRESENN